jgi:hypothetical protein
MSFRQLDVYKDSKNICLEIAGLRLLPDEITRRFGIAFVDEDALDGLGPMRGAVIQTDSGRRFGLVHYLQAPVKGTALWTYKHSLDLAGDLHDFLQSLGIRKDEIMYVHPRLKL